MASISSGTADYARERTTNTQRAAALVGLTFLLVGIAGFIPGVTENLDGITFAGHTSEAELLGIFQVSVLHNIVHLLFGIAGLVMAKRWASARTFLMGGGVIYLALFVYGLLAENHTDANFVPVNGPDDWLHFVLGVGMILLGLAVPKTDRDVVVTDRRY